MLVILGQGHEVVPLKDVTEGMRKKLQKLSQNIFHKIKRCRDIEKSGWRRLADLEAHTENIYQEIDEMAENMVCFIFMPDTSLSGTTLSTTHLHRENRWLIM
jgi:hypothetical protein